MYPCNTDCQLQKQPARQCLHCLKQHCNASPLVCEPRPGGRTTLGPSKLVWPDGGLRPVVHMPFSSSCSLSQWSVSCCELGEAPRTSPSIHSTSSSHSITFWVCHEWHWTSRLLQSPSTSCPGWSPFFVSGGTTFPYQQPRNSSPLGRDLSVWRPVHPSVSSSVTLMGSSKQFQGLEGLCVGLYASCSAGVSMLL